MSDLVFARREIAFFVFISLAGVLATSCGLNFDRNKFNDEPASSQGRASENELAAEKERSTVPTPSPTVTTPFTGSLVISLVDQNGAKPQGIPVEVTGPEKRQSLTNPEGIAEFKLVPGVYTYRVAAGCHDLVLVSTGGGRTLEISSTRSHSEEIRIVWSHRFGPGPSAFPSQYPYWFIGDEVAIEFEVADRCNQQRSPGKSIGTFGFSLSHNLELTRDPILVASEKGYATVYVTCTDSGKVSVVAFDRNNPSDRIELMDYALFPGAYPGEKFECRDEAER